MYNVKLISYQKDIQQYKKTLKKLKKNKRKCFDGSLPSIIILLFIWFLINKKSN